MVKVVVTVQDNTVEVGVVDTAGVVLTMVGGVATAVGGVVLTGMGGVTFSGGPEKATGDIIGPEGSFVSGEAILTSLASITAVFGC